MRLPHFPTVVMSLLLLVAVVTAPSYAEECCCSLNIQICACSASEEADCAVLCATDMESESALGIGDFYAAWDWKPEELKEKLRRRILKAFVRWEKLTPEAADIVACWELDKCGFSLFIGSPIAEDDRERLARLLRYLMRSPVSFKRLKYDEPTGKVTMRLKRDQVKVFDHAVDFLAAFQ